MTLPIAHCTLSVTTAQQPDPFLLSVDDDLGSRPLHLYPLQVGIWSQYAGVYDRYLPMALRMKKPGMRRVRLYCAERPESAVRLLANNGGEIRCLGRRREPLLETLTWVQAESQSLRYPYDQPAVTIRESTRFFDNDGKEVSKPTYLPALGTFRHQQPVTGAMVVAYQPGFFLYEIEYDTGGGEISAKAFQEIKLAWLAGNIRDAVIPRVRVIALSERQAAQISFPRSFWPEHSSADYSFQDTEKVLACIDTHGMPSYQYVESQRETVTERIYSKSDPNHYIDVQRTTALAFERRLLSGEPCAEENSGLGKPLLQMLLRFNT
ncbi:MAG: hypothetical protein H7835_05715 [Magnetococcus sp. XQGC-1]